jgi:hypothetical protein
MLNYFYNLGTTLYLDSFITTEFKNKLTFNPNYKKMTLITMPPLRIL